MDDAKLWDTIHEKTYQGSEMHSQYAEEKEKLFPKDSLVVELGSGTGADALYFLKKGHSLIALDISQYALDILNENAKREGLEEKLVIRYIDFGLHELPIKDDSVDIVYSRISLNYFGNKQTIKLFSDIYRMLKKGGKAFLTLKSSDDTNEMEYLKDNSVVYEENVFIEGGILRSRFSKEQLEEMLRSTEIKQFEVKPYQEDLSQKGSGHHSVLYVNEVAFTKL